MTVQKQNFESLPQRTSLEIARGLTGVGIPVFPCHEATTEEFDYSTGEFVTHSEKSPRTPNGLKGATTNARIIDIWFGERYSEAVIGVPTGESLGAWVLDLDRHGEADGHVWLAEMEAIHGALPDTARVRTANGGTHIFFKHIEGLGNRAAIAPGVDIRASQGYVIAAGSVMSDGRRYSWIDDVGQPYTPASIPEFAEAPEWLLEFLRPKSVPVAQQPYQHRECNNEAYVEAAVRQELESLASVRHGRNQAINQAAFSIGTLVGAGLLSRSEAEVGIMNAARANGYVAKDGEVAARKTMKSGLDSGIKIPRQIPERGAHDDTPPVDVTPLLESARRKQANDNQPAPAVDAPPMMEDPFNPSVAGGLLGTIAQWITETAIIPVPELSMAAAINLLAGAFGGKAIGPTNSGINVFTTVVMPTSGGKGHAPRCIRSLSSQMGASGSVVNSDPTSYAAFERILRKNPSTVVALDEFGVLLQDVNGRNASGASASIRRFLLAIYDQSNSIFDGKAYASAETKKDESPIAGPALSILGMTTSETLFAGISETSVTDGFLNRFLFISGDTPARISAPKLGAPPDAPEPLVDRLRVAMTSFPEYCGPRNSPIKKYRVPFVGGEEGEAYNRWSDVFLWQHRHEEDSSRRALIGRVAENTIRLATVRAISTFPSSPEVTAADVDWAFAIVHRSAGMMVEAVKQNVSGSPAEALRLAIMDALRRARKNELPYSQLLQRKGVSKADGRQVDDALRWLVDSDQIKDFSGNPKVGRGSRLAMKVKPERFPKTSEDDLHAA